MKDCGYRRPSCSTTVQTEGRFTTYLLNRVAMGPDTNLVAKSTL
jgi:hypothetical protein